VGHTIEYYCCCNSSFKKMKHLSKKLFVLLLGISFLAFPLSSFAAAPDGNGPWADSVLSANQGLMKNGNPVPAIRSNPSSALGVAENNTTDGNFYSLGFGGKLALGFDNGISSGVILVEATNPGYPQERAKVEVSENGTTWVVAGEVTQDGSVNKPGSIGCARYVRVTDISNPEDFSDDTADGYDVDGVKASGDPCTPTPTPGGGSNCDITQKNTTVVTTVIVAGANTGNNNSNQNTGGSNTTNTGDATNTVGVGVGGSSNTAEGGCCCGGGNVNANISANGANSTNTININNNKADKKAAKAPKVAKVKKK
jgi:hypothetical protein